MSVYLSSYTIEAFVSSAWSDITADVVGTIGGNWGIAGNAAIDNLADTGELTFTLKNQSDLYIPGHASVFDSGWDKNTPIKFTVTFDGNTTIRFRGYVDQLEVMSEAFNRKFVKVICVDWMDYAARFPLVTSSIGTDQRADEAITTIVAGMAVQPQETNYEIGSETFLTVFDDVSTESRGYSEFSKLVDSEFGYMYLRKSTTSGEMLVFEDRFFRSGLNTLHQYPVISASSDSLLMETGDKLLLETGDEILLDQGTDALFDNTMHSIEIQYGKDVVNHFRATAFPKSRDSSNVVLFSLNEPITLTPGVSLTFRTNYTDPVGGQAANAVSDTMVTPVATTDYLMNTASDGSGSNITDDITVTANYGTEGVTYTLLNANEAVGYVTFLQARGIGVYKYNPIQDISENAASIASHGYEKQAIRQSYQQTLIAGKLEADKITWMERNPRVDLEKVTFSANKDVTRMIAFIHADVGQLIRIKETDAEIDGYFYIQGVSFEIGLGGVIFYSLSVRQVFSLNSGLTMLAIEYDKDSTTAGVDGDSISFGQLPHLINQNKRSYSVWVFYTASVTDLGGIVGFWSDGATGPGNAVTVRSDDKIRFSQRFTEVVGRWETPAISLNAWHHIVATKDSSVDPLTDPIIYIDSVSQVLTEIDTPEGIVTNETGAFWTIGNYITAGKSWPAPFSGKIFDPRIYSSILTQANVNTLYNSGTIDNTLLIDSNLKFQACCVKDEEVAGFTGAAFSSTDRAIDNVTGFVGTPNNGPIGRTAP